MVITRPADVQHRLNVRVDEPKGIMRRRYKKKVVRNILEVVAISMDLEFTAVVVALEGCGVGKAANGARVIFPVAA
jgi:hypothetical protein